jgi:hypothetical protein
VILALAIVIVVSSVAASASRLRFVLAPTVLEPEGVLRALSTWKGSRGEALDRLERAIATAPEAEWESALLGALRAPSGVRTALINEQLSELDHRLQRWVRVPRVCASICTSSGFLLAATVLRVTLSGSEPVEGGTQGVDAAVLQALNVAAVGLAGAAFCIAIQMRARRVSASRAAAFDQLVQRLERAADETPATPDKESSNVRTA